MLLTEAQEQLAWEEIIAESSLTILRPEATARQVRDAWRLLQAWMLDCNAADFDYNEDTRAFHQWVRQFKQKCKDNGWLSESRIAHDMILHYKSGGQPGDCPVLLYGFDELTPQQLQLVTAMEEAGCQVRWLDIEAGDNDVHRVSCRDAEHEVGMACRWARQLLENQPSARVGIVAPDLGAKRASLLHGLNEIVSPQCLQPSSESPVPPWNLTLGLPLSQYTLIETAFLLLQLATGRVSVDECSLLLLSPYLGGAREEAGCRALLDGRLRDRADGDVSLGNVIYWSRDTGKPWHAPKLAAMLSEVRELDDARPSRATAGQWASWFSGVLKTGGWATDRGLTSEEYQALEAWRDVMAGFSALDEVAQPFNCTQAITRLKRLCQARIFQPRSGIVPLQVMGLYEAMGQHFDYLWVMDLHDQNWPALPRPNPFIPLPMQRFHGLPHADQARELAVAERITCRLLESADTVVVSYPAKQGEEELRPSPMIAGLPEIEATELPQWPGHSWQAVVRQHHRVEMLEDKQAPPLEEARASGGSGIFRAQSLCPFRAFAEYRLAARPLGTVQPGLDPMQRGTLFHRVLELFWKETKTHAALVDMDDKQRRQAAHDAIEQAIGEMAREFPNTMGSRFSNIEMARLEGLMLQWLEIEAARSPFTVVEFEAEKYGNVSGIDVRLKLDRIDRLPDGRRVIIDYKTGSVTPSKWFDERPEEPQLPLYSTVVGDDVAAVVYAQLKTGKLAFSGVVADERVIPGLPPQRNRQLKEVTDNWPAILEEWQQTIQRLAADFRSGNAVVDPVANDTCEKTYCSLQPLCRINEIDEYRWQQENGGGDE
jgi:probable DNA repair protein